MPSALANDASIAETTTQRDGSVDTFTGKMDGVIRRANTVITAATDSEKESSPQSVTVSSDRTVAEASAGEEKKKKPNKHSMDYMTRSFIAGGLAGCAVRTNLSVCAAD
ncbi:hypothetical protein ONZ43_g4040 [Nemania bipapillata]|uniref:Uncharacterized protein n=1 Tax=Nemania bipapillata TaxID=110536 RepID=A0ACC2IST2_9PEZI|nr:hypothetical protein ONZ43_g4040 [Nemania bipapillata]